MPAIAPAETVQGIQRMRSEGQRMGSIASELGISKSTVSKYAHSDIRAIVREVLAEMSGPVKVETSEVLPPRFTTNPRTRITDVTDKRYERIAFVSDLHHPFQDNTAIDAALAAIKDFRPHLLILGGDYFDCYSISSHDKEPERANTIQDEFDAARPTHQKIQEAVKDADVIWIDGNHEERINRLQRANPGLFRLRALELPALAELPKSWHYLPDQSRVKLGSLTALHGNTRGRGTNSKHAAAGMLAKLRTSVIFGHLHRFQSFMETADDGSVRAGWANGHLCDVHQARYITNPDWQQGVTLIEYDWSVGIFAVLPILVVNGHVLRGGKTYPQAQSSNT